MTQAGLHKMSIINQIKVDNRVLKPSQLIVLLLHTPTKKSQNEKNYGSYPSENDPLK